MRSRAVRRLAWASDPSPPRPWSRPSATGVTSKTAGSSPPGSVSSRANTPPEARHITKRGDPYLRTLLVMGARAVLQRAPSLTDPLSRWALAVRERRGYHRACIAIAVALAEPDQATSGKRCLTIEARARGLHAGPSALHSSVAD